MTLEKLLEITADFSETSPTNHLAPVAKTEEELENLAHNFHANNFSRDHMPQGGDYKTLNETKQEEFVGMRFFMPPIAAIGRADDPGFLKLKELGVVGPHHMLPTDWIPEAKTVISLFLPHPEELTASNEVDPIQPSYPWLFARVEGQQHLMAMGCCVRDALIAEGYQAVVPVADPRYMMKVAPMQTDIPIPTWSSNWSERHVGFVTGLGTFGRMTNFISKKGASGRIVSIVTDWVGEYTEKDYTGIFDYCSDCGECFVKCPAQALSMAGKDKAACSEFLRVNCAQYAPRYGCGKCQSGLPCARTACPKK